MLAFHLLPILFVGRKGRKGRFTAAESLQAFIDMKAVSTYCFKWTHSITLQTSEKVMQLLMF